MLWDDLKARVAIELLRQETECSRSLPGEFRSLYQEAIPRMIENPSVHAIQELCRHPQSPKIRILSLLSTQDEVRFLVRWAHEMGIEVVGNPLPHLNIVCLESPTVSGLVSLLATQLDDFSFHADSTIQLHPSVETMDRSVSAHLRGALQQTDIQRAIRQHGVKGAGRFGVMVADTGADQNHPMLRQVIKNWKSFVQDGSRTVHSHGSHVWSILAGNPYVWQGEEYGGVVPSLDHTFDARVLDHKGSGSTLGILRALEWAIEEKMRNNLEVMLVNMSLGSSGPNDGTDILSRKCTEATEHGVQVIASNGNSGGDTEGTVGRPACGQKVFAVGAVDRENRRADFSSIGPTADGRAKPQAVMPGTNIVAAKAHSEELIPRSGTSMSAPFATGIWALVASYLLKHKVEITPGLIWGICVKGARELDERDPNCVGAGLLNAESVLSIAKLYRKGRISYKELVDGMPFSEASIPATVMLPEERCQRSAWKHLAAAAIVGIALSVAGSGLLHRTQDIVIGSAVEAAKPAVSLSIPEIVDDMPQPHFQKQDARVEGIPVAILDAEQTCVEGQEDQLDFTLQKEWMEITQRTLENFNRALAKLE